MARLPPPLKTGGRPRIHPRRLICDAIFYLARAGCARHLLREDEPELVQLRDDERRIQRNAQQAASLDGCMRTRCHSMNGIAFRDNKLPGSLRYLKIPRMPTTVMPMTVITLTLR